MRVAVRELRAELVNVRTVAGRRLRAAGCSPRLGLLVWAVHPIRRHCTRSERVQRPVRGAALRNGCSALCVVATRAAAACWCGSGSHGG